MGIMDRCIGGSLERLQEEIETGASRQSGAFRAILEYLHSIAYHKDVKALEDFQRSLERLVVRVELKQTPVNEIGTFLLGKVQALADMAGVVAWHIPSKAWLDAVEEGKAVVALLAKRHRLTIEAIAESLNVTVDEAMDQCRKLLRNRVIVSSRCGRHRVFWATHAAKTVLEYDEAMATIQKSKN